MNAHGHNSATSYFDDVTSGAFYSWELTLPHGANNSILKICAIVYLFLDPVTYDFLFHLITSVTMETNQEYNYNFINHI